MSLIYLEHLPSENSWPSLRDIQLIILVTGLIEFFLFHLLADTKKSSTFFCWSINHTHKDSIALTKREDKSLVSAGDVDVVLRSLGMSINGGGEAMSFEEIVDLYEEENLRLEEVKEAFDVFDGNGDGFIDAEELQKVLCGLGFSEGMKVENCRRMIGVFDEDGDGRIDFHEFVSFLETSSLS